MKIWLPAAGDGCVADLWRCTEHGFIDPSIVGLTGSQAAVVRGSFWPTELKEKSCWILTLSAFRGLAAGEDNGQRGYMLTFVIAYLRVGHSSGFFPVSRSAELMCRCGRQGGHYLKGDRMVWSRESDLRRLDSMWSRLLSGGEGVCSQCVKSIVRWLLESLLLESWRTFWVCSKQQRWHERWTPDILSLQFHHSHRICVLSSTVGCANARSVLWAGLGDGLLCDWGVLWNVSALGQVKTR